MARNVSSRLRRSIFSCSRCIGLLGGAGQIMMTHSYRYADASIIAAFDYTAMLWAVALGLVLFGEIAVAAHSARRR